MTSQKIQYTRSQEKHINYDKLNEKLKNEDWSSFENGKIILNDETVKEIKQDGIIHGKRIQQLPLKNRRKIGYKNHNKSNNRSGFPQMTSVTEVEIQKYIKESVNPNKNTITTIAIPLKIIINKCFSENICTELFKTRISLPISKANQNVRQKTTANPIQQNFLKKRHILEWLPL